jgi:hypothetical protein
VIWVGGLLAWLGLGALVAAWNYGAHAPDRATHRTKEEVAGMDEMVQGFSDRDIWCALLVGWVNLVENAASAHGSWDEANELAGWLLDAPGALGWSDLPDPGTVAFRELRREALGEGEL